MFREKYLLSCSITDPSWPLLLYSPGQAFSFNTKQLWNQVSTDEGSPNDDDSYLGYSVATGEFTGDGVQDVAVGMPRGANLTGKVTSDSIFRCTLLLLKD